MSTKDRDLLFVATLRNNALFAGQRSHNAATLRSTRFRAWATSSRSLAASALKVDSGGTRRQERPRTANSKDPRCISVSGSSVFRSLDSRRQARLVQLFA